VALGDATAPGAARLAALREGVAGGGAVCLFPEAQHDAGLIDELAADTGVRIGAALDPNGSTLPPGPQAYEALLSGLATALADCLSGP
jgi:zinc transport system substrate-binding protein